MHARLGETPEAVLVIQELAQVDYIHIEETSILGTNAATVSLIDFVCINTASILL